MLGKTIAVGFLVALGGCAAQDVGSPGSGDRSIIPSGPEDDACASDPSACPAAAEPTCADDPTLPACAEDDPATPPGSGEPTPEPPPETPPGLETCEPPDVLFVLDRTLSMANTPDGVRPPQNGMAERNSTKWFIAFQTLRQAVTRFAGEARFGLELFPRDPGDGSCAKVGDLLSGRGHATNTQCQRGEVLALPALGAPVGDLIGSDTPLCRSTPVLSALQTADAALTSVASPDRQQFVVFISDGGDSCNVGSRDLILERVSDMARRGIRTIAVSFQEGNRGLLNDMACAGRMALGFDAACTELGAPGDFRAVDRAGDPLYLFANDATTLRGSLETIADRVRCPDPGDGDDPGDDNPLPDPY